MRRSIVYVLGLILAVFMLASCAEDGKDGINGKDATATPEAQMSTKGCLTCHSSYAETMAGSKHIIDAQPDNPYFFPPLGKDCIACHSPSGQDYKDVQPSDAVGGLACTSCHELDGKVKNNPIHSSYAVTSDNCIKCHNDLANHWYAPQYAHYFPYANKIGEKFGKLEQDLPGHSKAKGRAFDKETGEPKACGICHSGKVFAKIVNSVSPREVKEVTLANGVTKVQRTFGGASYKVTNDFATLYAPSAKNLNLDMPGSDTVSCDACHDSHAVNGYKGLRTKDYKVNDATVASAEFLLCTSCHIANVDISGSGKSLKVEISKLYTTNMDAEGNLIDVDASFMGYHGTDFTKSATHSILDTHFSGELYTTYKVNGDKVNVVNNAKISVKGYGIAPSSPNACTMCHDTHSSSIFEPSRDSLEYAGAAQTWGASKHGLEAASSSFIKEKTCQPCHGSRTQASAIHNNVFDKLPGTEPFPSQVGCLTCHVGTEKNTDNNTATVIDGASAKELYVINSAAAFRNSFTFAMTDDQFAAIKAKYPTNDVMLCGGCHSGGHGGGTGGNVTTAFVDVDDTVADDAVKVYTGHYDAAFGAMTGLVFDLTENLLSGKTYDGAGVNVDAHMEIGCLSCHVTTKDDHSFAVYSDDAKITLKNTSPECKLCHTSGTISGNFGESTTNRVNSLQSILSEVLPGRKSSGINKTNVPDATTRKKLSIAIGNLNVLKGSGMEAHLNTKLIQQLVYDNMVVLAPYMGLSFQGTDVLKFDGIKKFAADNNSDVVTIDALTLNRANGLFSEFSR